MAQNVQQLANQGQFHARVPPDQPVTAKGHAPGVNLGKDAVPEFSAQTLPAGSAPPDRTFQPSVPAVDGNDQGEELQSSVEDTLHGSTSKDVNRGIGQPIYGQTSNKSRGRGETVRGGLVGVGADPRDPVRERALDIDVPKGTRGKSGTNRENVPGAEEKLPEDAMKVASERA